MVLFILLEINSKMDAIYGTVHVSKLIIKHDHFVQQVSWTWDHNLQQDDLS